MKTQFKNSFLKAIKRISDPEIKKEVVAVINNVESASGPRQIKNIKKLIGYKNCFRIKINDYHIGVKITGDTVNFVACEHRKNIYRIFP